MQKTTKYLAIISICFLVFYVTSILGCKFFPSLAQGCSEESLLFSLLYGLLYLLVAASLVIIPLIAIVYIRVTIIMPISKFIYGDGNVLDAKLFGWFDKCWNLCK